MAYETDRGVSATAGASSPTGAYGAWPRWVSIILGAWLFISAFLWPHSDASQTNTWIVGALIAAVGAVALYVPWARWGNTALAVWLFIAAFALPHVTDGTPWNNVIASIIVFAASLVPGSLRPGAGRPARVAHA